MATSPDKPEPDEDTMRPQYDFRSMKGVVRGKYFDRVQREGIGRVRMVPIAIEVAKEFADVNAINEVLREYLRNRKAEPPAAISG